MLTRMVLRSAPDHDSTYKKTRHIYAEIRLYLYLSTYICNADNDHATLLVNKDNLKDVVFLGHIIQGQARHPNRVFTVSSIVACFGL